MKWLKLIYDINKDLCLIKYGIHKSFHLKKKNDNLQNVLRKRFRKKYFYKNYFQIIHKNTFEFFFIWNKFLIKSFRKFFSFRDMFICNHFKKLSRLKRSPIYNIILSIFLQGKKMWNTCTIRNFSYCN